MTTHSSISAFDTLPVHPKPQRLESVTGYFTRVGEVNHINTLYGLSMLLFPGIEPRTIRHMADYPLSSFGVLPMRLLCSEQALLRTTFYHLGRAFGRSPQPQPLSRFLSGSLASHFRFCPACLASARVRLLTWRFLAITGCSIHHCRLIDSCPHCGRDIPLLAAPLHVGRCPKCEGDLRDRQPYILDQSELDLVQTRTQDLVYVLSEPQFPSPVKPAYALGRVLIARRNEQQLTLEEAGHLLGKSKSAVRDIELGVIERGTTFGDYVRYTELLGITLQTLLHEANVLDNATPTPAEAERRRTLRRQRYAEHVAQAKKLGPDKLQELRQGFERGQSNQDIATALGLDRRLIWAIRHHWGLAEQWRQLSNNRRLAAREARAEALLQEVKDAVRAITKERQVATIVEIAARVGMSPAGLARYRRVRAYLQKYASARGRRSRNSGRQASQ